MSVMSIFMIVAGPIVVFILGAVSGFCSGYMSGFKRGIELAISLGKGFVDSVSKKD